MGTWLIFYMVSINSAHAKENQTQPEQASDDQQGSGSNPLPAFTSGFSAFSPVTFPGATTESIQAREDSGFGSAFGSHGFGSDFFKNALDQKETTPSGPEGRSNQGFGNGFSNDFFKANIDGGETTPSSAPDARDNSGFGQAFSSDFYKANVDTEETTLPVSSLAPRNGTNGTEAEGKERE